MAVTAPAPEGPWSEPVDLGLTAIDPGHIADEEEVTVEMSIEEGTQGRLLLFYNQNYYSGMGISKDGVYGILHGWQIPAIPYNSNHVHIRLRSTAHEVNFYYSSDGSHWTKLPHSFDASCFHHNALGGFLALRIGLDALGDGKVVFRNFEYRRL